MGGTRSTQKGLNMCTKKELWENFNAGLCSYTEFNGETNTEVTKVENLVSIEGDIFEGTRKRAKLNVL